jgi:hypothetical protein
MLMNSASALKMRRYSYMIDVRLRQTAWLLVNDEGKQLDRVTIVGEKMLDRAPVMYYKPVPGSL